MQSLIAALETARYLKYAISGVTCSNRNVAVAEGAVDIEACTCSLGLEASGPDAKGPPLAGV